MAYLERIDTVDKQPLPLPVRVNVEVPEPQFSSLEWSVIRLARDDRLWTIKSAGRFGRFWNWLVGRTNPELAKPELEALRRMAVLTWHFGFTVPGEAVSEFLSAGFSLDQYELLAGSINAVLASRKRIPA